MVWEQYKRGNVFPIYGHFWNTEWMESGVLLQGLSEWTQITELEVFSIVAMMESPPKNWANSYPKHVIRARDLQVCPLMTFQ